MSQGDKIILTALRSAKDYRLTARIPWTDAYNHRLVRDLDEGPMSVTTSLIGIRRLPGGHRGNAPLQPHQINNEKLSYIDRYLPYLALVITIGNSSVIASQSAIGDPLITSRYSFLPTVFSAIYVAISVIAKLHRQRIRLRCPHEARVRTWRPSPPTRI